MTVKWVKNEFSVFSHFLTRIPDVVGVIVFAFLSYHCTTWKEGRFVGKDGSGLKQERKGKEFHNWIKRDRKMSTKRLFIGAIDPLHYIHIRHC